MTEYSIEKLRETFLEHAEQSGISQDHQKQMWKEMNPDTPFPDHMIDDFSLAKALASMCDQIIWLTGKQQD